VCTICRSDNYAYDITGGGLQMAKMDAGGVKLKETIREGPAMSGYNTIWRNESSFKESGPAYKDATVLMLFKPTLDGSTRYYLQAYSQDYQGSTRASLQILSAATPDVRVRMWPGYGSCPTFTKVANGDTILVVGAFRYKDQQIGMMKNLTTGAVEESVVRNTATPLSATYSSLKFTAPGIEMATRSHILYFCLWDHFLAPNHLRKLLEEPYCFIQ